MIEALPKEVIVVYFVGYAMSGRTRVRLQLQRAQHPEDVDAGRTIGVDELMDSMLRLPTRRKNCFVLAVLDCGYLSEKKLAHRTYCISVVLLLATFKSSRRIMHVQTEQHTSDRNIEQQHNSKHWKQNGMHISPQPQHPNSNTKSQHESTQSTTQFNVLPVCQYVFFWFK